MAKNLVLWCLQNAFIYENSSFLWVCSTYNQKFIDVRPFHGHLSRISSRPIKVPCLPVFPKFAQFGTLPTPDIVRWRMFSYPDLGLFPLELVMVNSLWHFHIRRSAYCWGWVPLFSHPHPFRTPVKYENVIENWLADFTNVTLFLVHSLRKI